MREVDPITQCEVFKPSPLLFQMAMYAAPYMGVANDMGLFNVPRLRGNWKPPWYNVDLTKEERKLPPEDRNELRRYKWALKQISGRD